jgi:hypothetical protein
MSKIVQRNFCSVVDFRDHALKQATKDSFPVLTFLDFMTIIRCYITCVFKTWLFNNPSQSGDSELTENKREASLLIPLLRLYHHFILYHHLLLLLVLIMLRNLLCLELISHGSRDSAVGIATGYGLGGRGVEVPVPVGSRIFSSPRRPDRFWGPPSLLFNG